jgi:hypothetical protein
VTALVNRMRCVRGRGGCQDERGRGIQVLAAMVFPDSKGVQAGSIGELDLLDQVAQSIRAADREACVVVSCGEAVNADLHLILPLCWSDSGV